MKIYEFIQEYGKLPIVFVYLLAALTANLILLFLFQADLLVLGLTNFLAPMVSAILIFKRVI